MSELRQSCTNRQYFLLTQMACPDPWHHSHDVSDWNYGGIILELFFLMCCLLAPYLQRDLESGPRGAVDVREVAAGSSDARYVRIGGVHEQK